MKSMEKTPPDKNANNAPKKMSDQMVDKGLETFKWWNNLATLNKEDSIAMSLVKISIRIVGIIIMLAISPIAIVALMIAFAAVI